MPRPVPDLPPFGRGSVGAFIPRSGANYAGFKHIPFVQRHRFRIFLGCVALATYFYDPMGLTRTGIEREIRQDLAESMSFAARVTTIADRITTFVAPRPPSPATAASLAAFEAQRARAGHAQTVLGNPNTTNPDVLAARKQTADFATSLAANRANMAAAGKLRRQDDDDDAAYAAYVNDNGSNK